MYHMYIGYQAFKLTFLGGGGGDTEHFSGKSGALRWWYLYCFMTCNCLPWQLVMSLDNVTRGFQNKLFLHQCKSYTDLLPAARTDETKIRWCPSYSVSVSETWFRFWLVLITNLFSVFFFSFFLLGLSFSDCDYFSTLLTTGKRISIKPVKAGEFLPTSII